MIFLKKVLIIAHFCGAGDSASNNRFDYLFKVMKKKHMDVQLITSDFSHNDKHHRCKSKDKDIILIHEPGYSKNICIKRFYSHYIFAKNVKKYLYEMDRIPDIVYCAVPSIDVGKVVSEFCISYNIPFYIDIQDLWPEAFFLVFHVPFISDAIFFLMKRAIDLTYARADHIIAVSDTYRKRALKVNKKGATSQTIYLGTDLNDLDFALDKGMSPLKKDSYSLWIVYLGTLGRSYDLRTVIMAMKEVQKQHENAQILFLGSGPDEMNLKKYANKNKVNAIFLGRRTYIEAMHILNQCDIALNPLVKGAPQSIINKVCDYAALSLPVISSLNNEEYQMLIEKYEAGFNIESENSKALSEKIIYLIEHEKVRRLMGKNNRKLAEDCFDRRTQYIKIVDSIEKDKGAF